MIPPKIYNPALKIYNPALKIYNPALKIYNPAPKIYNSALKIITCDSFEWFPDPILNSGSSESDGVTSIMVGASGVTVLLGFESSWSITTPSSKFWTGSSSISSLGSVVVSLIESETESEWIVFSRSAGSTVRLDLWRGESASEGSDTDPSQTYHVKVQICVFSEALVHNFSSIIIIYPIMIRFIKDLLHYFNFPVVKKMNCPVVFIRRRTIKDRLVSSKNHRTRS